MVFLLDLQHRRHIMPQEAPSIPDYLKVIRLGHGKGEPGKQACWMTALNSHLGGKWTDRCECVDPVINEYCIGINDAYGRDDDSRSKGIMEFGLFRPLGTAGDEAATIRRMWHLVDATIRRIVPLVLNVVDLVPMSNELRSLGWIGDTSTAEEAKRILICADRELSSRSVLNYSVRVYSANMCVTSSVAMVIHALNGDVYRAATTSGGIAKTASSAVGFYAMREFISDNFFPLLAELIEMGPHGPVEQSEPVCGVKRFHELVGVK
jgi:hypothetical protein